MAGKRSLMDTGLNAVQRKSSTESTASVSAVTTGRFTTPRTDEAEQEVSFITSFGKDISNTVCVLIWCPRHKKTGLCPVSEGKGLFFPSAPVKFGQGSYEAVVLRTKEALSVDSPPANKKPYLSFSTPRLYHQLDIQVPNYLEFIGRRIYGTELTYDQKHTTECCHNSERIIWLTKEEVKSNRDIWGPEPNIFVDLMASATLHKLEPCVEFTVKDVLKFLPRDPPRTYQEELVLRGGFERETDIFRLFGDFLQMCWPSQYLSEKAFDLYITKIGLKENTNSDQDRDKAALFRAFGFNGQSYLSFFEVLLGFCAMSSNVPHGGHTGELRSSYIFRYYSTGQDSNGQNILTTDDIKKMAQDIDRLKEGRPATVDPKKIFEACTGDPERKTIDIKSFVKAIGDRKLRGTAPLFRAIESPHQIIRTKTAFEGLAKTQIQTAAAAGQLRGLHGTCARCRAKKYTLARHTVKLSKDGEIIDPQENRGQADVDRMDKGLRRKSDKCFLGSTFANVLLDEIREFAYTSVPGITRPANRTRNPTNRWSAKPSRKEFAEKIMKDFFPQCQKLFRQEPRLIHVSSPTFVLGDLHGNLHDLMFYENSLWKMGPSCVAANFLFLGDYVDRGDHGIEVILYLMAQKMLYPERYLMCRGNHELRNVQLGFTFKTECLEKLGNKLGERFWLALNEVFDYMPICAIIDESIFCAHGGIPAHTIKIEELYRIPTPLKNPEEESPIAWEILWNDPVGPQEFQSYAEMARNANAVPPPQGFLANAKRGTAYYFSEYALTRFLESNHLSHVIRGHEVIPNGYQYHMGGKCVTVFSSSKYCGGLNEAAVVLVNDEKIRVIKIDTN